MLVRMYNYWAATNFTKLYSGRASFYQAELYAGWFFT